MDIREQTTADLLREWERREAFVGFTDEAHDEKGISETV